MANDFAAGEYVRVKEVRGSPRPPATWLGKRGRILSRVSPEGETAWPERSHRGSKPVPPEAQYLVELEGSLGTQAVADSWLARV